MTRQKRRNDQSKECRTRPEAELSLRNRQPSLGTPRSHCRTRAAPRPAERSAPPVTLSNDEPHPRHGGRAQGPRPASGSATRRESNSTTSEKRPEKRPAPRGLRGGRPLGRGRARTRDVRGSRVDPRGFRGFRNHRRRRGRSRRRRRRGSQRRAVQFPGRTSAWECRECPATATRRE